jgi:hypothetical protein
MLGRGVHSVPSFAGEPLKTRRPARGEIYLKRTGYVLRVR